MQPLLERRAFFKRALALGAGVAMGGHLLRGESTAAVRLLKKPSVADQSFDVIIAGAGTGGVPAAIAAARTGAKVALLEACEFIGGAPTNMFVTFVYGKQRNGIYGEMLDLLNARGEMQGHPLENFNRGLDGRSHWYLPSSYMRVLTAMVHAEKNITLFTNVSVTGVFSHNKAGRPCVSGVRILCGGREMNLLGKITVDATGTGEVAEMAGCECLYGRESLAQYNEKFAPEKADDTVQPMTLMYVAQALRSSARVDWKSLRTVSMVKANLGWKAQGALAKENKNTQAYLCWGPTIQGIDTRDPVQIGQAYTQALLEGEDDFARLLQSGFSVQLAPRIGLRECRRVVGQTMITLHDLESGKLPSDTIAVGEYPLDIWGQGINYKLPLYGIPYRAVVPKGVDGLLIAGKSISGTHVAMSAYRVQSIVGPTGQGIGTAAAMAAASGVSPRDLPIKPLQEILVKAGTIPAEFS